MPSTLNETTAELVQFCFKWPILQKYWYENTKDCWLRYAVLETFLYPVNIWNNRKKSENNVWGFYFSVPYARLLSVKQILTCTMDTKKHFVIAIPHNAAAEFASGCFEWT
jgi:hypothetical protein